MCSRIWKRRQLTLTNLKGKLPLPFYDMSFAAKKKKSKQIEVDLVEGVKFNIVECFRIKISNARRSFQAKIVCIFVEEC